MTTTPDNVSTPASHADPDNSLLSIHAGVREDLDDRGTRQLREAQLRRTRAHNARKRRLGHWNRFSEKWLLPLALGLPALLVVLYFLSRVTYAVLSIPGQNVFFGLLLICAVAVQIALILKFAGALAEAWRKKQSLPKIWNAAWLFELGNGLGIGAFVIFSGHELIKAVWLRHYAYDLLIAAAVLLLWQIIVVWRDRTSQRRTFAGLLALCLSMGLIVLAAFAVSLGYTTTGSDNQSAAGSNTGTITAPATQDTGQEAAADNTVASGFTRNFTVKVTGACPGPYVLTITNKNTSGSQSDYRVNIDGDNTAKTGSLGPGEIHPIQIGTAKWLIAVVEVVDHKKQVANVTPEC